MIAVSLPFHRLAERSAAAGTQRKHESRMMEALRVTPEPLHFKIGERCRLSKEHEARKRLGACHETDGSDGCKITEADRGVGHRTRSALRPHLFVNLVEPSRSAMALAIVSSVAITIRTPPS